MLCLCIPAAKSFFGCMLFLCPVNAARNALRIPPPYLPRELNTPYIPIKYLCRELLQWPKEGRYFSLKFYDTILFIHLFAFLNNALEFQVIALTTPCGF